jgi:p38 MAP kinase
MPSDLKPSNILVTEECQIRIGGLGLVKNEESQMTGCITARYYRAPEAMLNWQKYDSGADLWSIGCIFAEMITAKVLFPGKDRKFARC